MSKIGMAIGILESYYKEEEERKQLLDLEIKTKLQAYKENRFEDLVSTLPYLNFETINIGELEYGYDYEIITGCYRTFNDEYVEDEEEFKEVWNREYEAYKDEFEIEVKEFEIDNKGNKEIVYRMTNSTGEIIGDFETEQEADEYLDEAATEYVNEIVGAELDDLEFEYDEIYWNIVGRFNDNSGINIENAQTAGMSVVELRNGETYLSLGGCGMDMSFQHMEYLILTYGGLTLNYATSSRLDWLRTMKGDERFIELMVMCGLDEELLRKYMKK